MSDAMAIKACLMLVFALAIAQEVLVMAVPQEDRVRDLALAVTSHGSFEEFPPSEEFSPDVTAEEIMVRKHATIGEADVIGELPLVRPTNGLSFMAVDGSGELPMVRRRELGNDEKRAMAVTSLGSLEEISPSEEFYPVVADEDIMVRRHATIGEADVLSNNIPFEAVHALHELPMGRRRDLGIDNMEMEALAETDAPKGEPKAGVENPDVTKKPEAMVEASLDQQVACADISGRYSEEKSGLQVDVVTAGGCAFKFDGGVDIAVSGNIVVLMGARREFSGAVDGGGITFNNGVVWSRQPKGPTVPGPL